MHPANIECFRVAKVDYVSLANDHTLDFGRTGLFETIKVLDNAGIAHAGAGYDVPSAQRPAILKLPKTVDPVGRDRQEHKVHLYSFSDHPSDWATVPESNSIRYAVLDRVKMRSLLIQGEHEGASNPSLKVVSLHRGPHYSWKPDEEIMSLAHFLIDECDVDIIHGHSPHRVQGLNVYNSKLILYSCGDFLNDYAVVPDFRNDPSAIWNVAVAEIGHGKFELQRVEVYLTRIKNFKAGLMPAGDSDQGFVTDRIRSLSADLGTVIENKLGSGGQIVVDMTRNARQT